MNTKRRGALGRAVVGGGFCSPSCDCVRQSLPPSNDASPVGRAKTAKHGLRPCCGGCVLRRKKNTAVLLSRVLETQATACARSSPFPPAGLLGAPVCL